MTEDFEFKTPPYEHQLKVFKTSRDEVAFGLLLDMGTGKSKVLIDTASWLFLRKKINGLLIVAPKGVFSTWVTDQLPDHTPTDIYARAVIVKWQENNQAKYFKEQLKKISKPDPDSLHILVMNVDATRVKHGIKTCVDFLMSHNVLMVVDESSVISKPTSQRSKNIVKLGRGAKYRRILTGTPISNSPLDIYTQFEFLDPKILGHDSFYAFRNRYAQTRKRRINGRDFIEVYGYQRLDELQEKMSKAAIILKKEDCLDLPEKIFTKREFMMSNRQRDAYEDLRKTSIAILSEMKVVTTTMALTQLLRLHQIANGFVTLDDIQDIMDDIEGKPRRKPPTIEELDTDGGPRVRALLDILDEMSVEKVIIWANYTYNIKTITRVLKEKYGPDSTAAYAGQTGQDERDLIRKNFQDEKHPLRFFIGQTRTGGYGLTLTRAHNVIYFSNDYDYSVRRQSEDRAHRIGQTECVTYVDLFADRSVDTKILEALKKKHDLSEQVTGPSWRNVFSD